MLSKTVADAFSLCRVIQPNAGSITNDTTETENFCRVFNKFFDCLNTRSLEEAARKRNKDVDCYRSGDDTRLKVQIVYLISNYI